MRKRILPAVAMLALAFLMVFQFVAPRFAGVELRMRVDAPDHAQSQVFLPVFGDMLAPRDSVRLDLRPGENAVRVPLRSASSWVRWDPSEAPGAFVLHDPQLHLAFGAVPLDAAAFSALQDIASIAHHGDSIVIATTAGTLDPAVRIDLPRKRILLDRLAVTAIIMAVAALALSALRALRASGGGVPRDPARLLRDDTGGYWKFLYLILIAAAFSLSLLTTYNLSVDQEAAALREDQSVWVVQGRWAVYLLTNFVLPQPVIPFLPNALLGLGLTLAYLLILRAHRLPLDWRAVALFPLFMGAPVWFFISEFYANLLPVAVGSVLVAWSLARHAACMDAAGQRDFSVGRLAAFLGGQCVLVGSAIGMYQSYLFAYGAAGLGLLLLRGDRPARFEARMWARHLGLLALTAIAAFVFNQGVLKAFQWGLGVDTGYLALFVHLDALLAEPVAVVWAGVAEMMDIYLGAAAVFGVGIGSLGLLALAGAIALVAGRGTGLERGLALLLLFACMLAPFALNFLAGVDRNVPFRSMVGVPYVAWLLGALALHLAARQWRPLVVCVLAAAVFQLANAHSTYAAAKALALDRDKALAGQLYYQIAAAIPDFDRHGRNKVDIYGAWKLDTVFPSVPTSTIGASFFDWDGGNPFRIVNFMRLIGYSGLVAASNEERRRLLRHYDTMPLWPARGSVRRVDDVVLVKMGPQPGYVHRKFEW